MPQLWALGCIADIKVLQEQASPLLTEAEIRENIATYAEAANNAPCRIFGVEIYDANGYLFDRLPQTTSNKHTDKWGGDEEGRTRFTRKVVDAVVVGEERIALRISPWSDFQDKKIPDPQPAFAYLAAALRDKHPNLAYIHVVEPGADITASVDGRNDFFARDVEQWTWW